MMKKQKERPKYNIFQNILFLLKDIRQEHPILILFILTEIVLSVISPVFGIYIPKAALDLVLERAHPEQVFFYPWHLWAHYDSFHGACPE